MAEIPKCQIPDTPPGEFPDSAKTAPPPPPQKVPPTPPKTRKSGNLGGRGGRKCQKSGKTAVSGVFRGDGPLFGPPKSFGPPPGGAKKNPTRRDTRITPQNDQMQLMPPPPDLCLFDRPVFLVFSKSFKIPPKKGFLGGQKPKKDPPRPPKSHFFHPPRPPQKS